MRVPFSFLAGDDEQGDLSDTQVAFLEGLSLGCRIGRSLRAHPWRYTGLTAQLVELEQAGEVMDSIAAKLKISERTARRIRDVAVRRGLVAYRPRGRPTRRR